MKNIFTIVALAILLLIAGCAGNDPGKKFFTGEVAGSVPENETVISFNDSTVVENEELREVVRKTVEYYEDGGSRTRTIAASPRAVEQYETLPTGYIEYRNETVEVTVLIES